MAANNYLPQQNSEYVQRCVIVSREVAGYGMVINTSRGKPAIVQSVVVGKLFTQNISAFISYILK